MDPAWALDLLDRARGSGVGSDWARRTGAADPKGGDPSEWPESFRVREFPASPIPAALTGRAHPAPLFAAR